MVAQSVQLKPQDIIVLLKLAVRRDTNWTYPQLAASLGLSVSEVHAGIRRAVLARLAFLKDPRAVAVNAQNLLEFLVHGVKYAFPVVRGPITRGHPTAHAAPVLRRAITGAEGIPPVWPDPEGPVRGEGFPPLYPSPSVVRALLADPPMYDAAALVDAIRGGSARERKIAADLLGRLLLGKGAR